MRQQGRAPQPTPLDWTAGPVSAPTGRRPRSARVFPPRPWTKKDCFPANPLVGPVQASGQVVRLTSAHPIQLVRLPEATAGEVRMTCGRILGYTTILACGTCGSMISPSTAHLRQSVRCPCIHHRSATALSATEKPHNCQIVSTPRTTMEAICVFAANTPAGQPPASTNPPGSRAAARPR